jgi:hypothetical protein
MGTRQLPSLGWRSSGLIGIHTRELCNVNRLAGIR